MKNVWLYLLTVIVLSGTVSCVKDNGNYDYKDVNEVLATLPVTYTRVYLQDTVIRVAPVIHQTMAQDESNLSFAWRYSTTGYGAARTAGIISTENHVNLTITSADRDFQHLYWLEITDKLTGVVYPYYTKILVLKPFATTWAVLYSDGGSAKLGAIEYLEEVQPIKHFDIFAANGYPALTGFPVALGADNADQADTSGYAVVAYNAMYMITTNPLESGVYAPWSRFSPYVSGVFIPQMVQNYAPAGFDAADISYIYRANSNGGLLLNDGRFFQMRNGLRCYEAPIAASLGTIRIDKAVQIGAITLMYDGIGKRFLYFNHGTIRNSSVVPGEFTNDENMEEIRSLDRPANTIPLNGIQGQVLYLGVGNRTNTNIYSYVKSFAIVNGDNGKTSAYLFPTSSQIISSTSNVSIEEVKEFDTPEGLDGNSLFASSQVYNNIVFYSSGNKIYRLDFSTGTATLIYTHTSGGEIVAMHIAKQEPVSNIAYNSNAYGHPMERSLGVAVNNGLSGELVTINLSASGEIIKTTTFTGFGAIKDICFLCDKQQ